MNCERCNNNTVQTISYSSCAQANADNHLGYNDWIPQSYIPAMGWQNPGDGTICLPYGQGLVQNWLNSGANTVHSSGGGSSDDPSGDDPGGDPVGDPVGDFVYPTPTVSPCGPRFYISNNGENLDEGGLSSGTFTGYICMRCDDAFGPNVTTPSAYGADAVQLGVTSGTFITCDQANAVNFAGYNTWAPQHTYWMSEPCGCDGEPTDPIVTIDDHGNPVVIDDPGGEQCYDNVAPTVPTVVVEPTIITMSGTLSEIPTRRINHITNLVSPSKPDLFNKPQAYVDSAGNTVYQTLVDHFINASAVVHSIRVVGDSMTDFNLMLFDETNSKWYDWDNNTFGAGYNVLSGKAGAVASGHPDTFDINFPAVSATTTYKIKFIESSPTVYLPHPATPTDLTQEWTISQMQNCTTSINWGTSVSGVSVVTNGTSGSTNGAFDVISPCGTDLSVGSNSGIFSFTITFFVAGSKTMRFNPSRLDFYGSGIHDDVATVNDLDTPTIGNFNTIISMSLTASIVNNGGSSGSTGTLTGTITYGQLPLHDQSFIFNPDNFFTLA